MRFEQSEFIGSIGFMNETVSARSFASCHVLYRFCVFFSILAKIAFYFSVSTSTSACFEALSCAFHCSYAVAVCRQTVFVENYARDTNPNTLRIIAEKQRIY